MPESKNHGDHGGAGGVRPQLLSGLSPGDYAQTLAAARVKEFTRDEVLYLQGQPVQQVLLVTSGLLKITKLGRGGTEVILRLGVPGETAGVGDQFSTGRHSATAQGFRAGHVLVWDPLVFKTLMTHLPVLHQNVVRILSLDLWELQERFRELASKRVSLRVARQLVRLLEKIGQPVADEVKLDLSHEELAQMTGTTAFTICRLLATWKERGLVRSRREALIIRNVELLRAISNETDFREPGDGPGSEMLHGAE